MKINTLITDKHEYLEKLNIIANYPKKLYKIGQIPEKNTTTIAIVGSRKPTPYGREVAEMLATELSQHNIVIVSGLALGIDGIAHRAALRAGGVTLAVLAHGLDTIYPTTHKTLGEQIVQNKGALLSEYAPGIPPLPHQFLARNRIVSGLADAVIIVEAAARSGTLSTAAHALDQGREVFAVPGNITNPLSAGCNALIKQGALPVTSTQDILEIIRPTYTPTQTQFALGDTQEEKTILQLLAEGQRDGDVLLENSLLDPDIFNQTLTMLEIKGLIKPLGANQWTLR